VCSIPGFCGPRATSTRHFKFIKKELLTSMARQSKATTATRAVSPQQGTKRDHLGDEELTRQVAQRTEASNEEKAEPTTKQLLLKDSRSDADILTALTTVMDKYTKDGEIREETECVIELLVEFLIERLLHSGNEDVVERACLIITDACRSQELREHFFKARALYALCRAGDYLYCINNIRAMKNAHEGVLLLLEYTKSL